MNIYTKSENRRFNEVKFCTAGSWKRGKLQDLQASLKVEKSVFVVKTLLKKCRCCKEGNLVTLAIFGNKGPPERFLGVFSTMSAK